MSVSTTFFHCLVNDFFLKGIRPFYEGFISFTIHLFNFLMFFQPSNIQSSSIEDIKFNLVNYQVMVKYIGNAKTYLYENVSAEAITDVLTGEIESLGKFVNAFCKGNMVTTIA